MSATLEAKSQQPETPVRWAIRDSLVITRRHLTHLAQLPAQLIGNLVFPVLLVLIFGFVFGSAITIPGGGNYRAFLMPGKFVMAMDRIDAREARAVAVTFAGSLPRNTEILHL